MQAMKSALRNVLAVALGVLLGSAVNMALITLGPLLIPPPDGVDLNDTERFAENLRRLQPVHFLMPWLAHALGTLVGALLAARLAVSHHLTCALLVGVVFMTGGALVVMRYGGPPWFIAMDLLGAYLPMAFWGGKLARRKTLPNAK